MTISHFLNFNTFEVYTNMKFIIFFIIVTISISAQSDILEKYIQEGLSNNLMLKQKDYLLQKSEAAHKEAAGLYFPSLELNARYTKANGGRTIDLPIGDLVNPIYSGLNAVIGQPVYPTDIPNETINFLRKTEHETKLHLVQPIFKPEIYFNERIKSDLTNLEKAARNSHARDLVQSIKTAYYNYLKTSKIVELYDAVEILVNENLKVSKSLYQNSKVTADVLFRAEAELSSVYEEKLNAEKNMELARSYFNYLLNKPLKSEIEADNSLIPESNKIENINYKEILSRREEIKQLEFAIKASESSVSLNRSNYLPDVVLAVDYGFQGESYKFNSDYDFWMASLVMQWNLFNGFQDNAKIEQAILSKKELEAKKLELEKSLTLQIREVLLQLEVSKQKIQTSQKQRKGSEESFRIIEKKYENNMASQIEFIDARTHLTKSSINSIISFYDHLSNLAAFERVTSSYPLPNNE